MSEQTAEQTAEATEASEQASTEAKTEQATEKRPEKVDGEDALGDKGKKALDTMKAERKAAQEEARRIREEFEAFKAQAEGREKEFQAEQERRKVEAEALEKANDRIRRAEVRAAAAGKLSDPADALRFIDVSSFEVGDDGEVDAEAINSAITDLINTKPYLAVQDSKRFQGDADAGTRKEARPAQLSKADVDRLYAEGKHEEIVKAKAEGRLADYLAS
jgi:hypothetical protein